MESVPTLGHIRSRLRYGDYVLLGELLGISSDAAKKRLSRKNKAAIAAMLTIIENRERFIEKYRSETEEASKIKNED